MMRIFATHRPGKESLELAKDQIKRDGIPVIRIVSFGEYYMTLEKSEQLAACHAMGITPELVIYQMFDRINPIGIERLEGEWKPETLYAANEILSEVHSAHSRSYDFDKK